MFSQMQTSLSNMLFNIAVESTYSIRVGNFCTGTDIFLLWWLQPSTGFVSQQTWNITPIQPFIFNYNFTNYKIGPIESSRKESRIANAMAFFFVLVNICIEK